MSDATIPYRDREAMDETLLGLRRALRGDLDKDERAEVEATILYFWNYCVNPNLIELRDGTVLHIHESGHTDKHGVAKFCTECGHGAYIKGEDLCGNCLPMEWHDKPKKDDDE